MRTICLFFQIHQPFRLRRYRFFDIGTEHYYYDDYSNESTLHRAAEKSYIHANKILLETINKHKDKFKVAFSISGTALDQFELYAPEVLESFQKLAATGQVEFLCETDSHSLVSLSNPEEFEKQVNAHRFKINKVFGQNPVVFSNTELIYSDQIGAQIADMGFEGMVTEGAKQILGWKSPNYLYCSAINPKLKLLLRNFKLSDDISFRFSNQNWSEYPLTTEKFASWLNTIDKKEETINIFINYESFGGYQTRQSGIFEFFKYLPETIFKLTNYTFSTPTEIIRQQQPIAAVSIPSPISWVDEERDITAWLGNDLQKEAFTKLYRLLDYIKECNDPKLLVDWKYLQSSDHFYYMSTKFFSDRPAHSYANPYGSPYDAFINYMNVLNDFSMRVKKATISNGEDSVPIVEDLLRLLDEKDSLLAQYQTQVSKESLNVEKKPSAKSKKETDKKLQPVLVTKNNKKK
ncbi:MAG: glycoside hydrolase family 57 protein [Bacteroidota bacterium]|nr:glycoside hydrolase family 57 protein [Bacteroidota bacterium]